MAIQRNEVPRRFRELRDDLLLLAGSGASERLIAELAGLDKSTLIEWLRDAEEWPEVAEFKLEFRRRQAMRHLASHKLIAESDDTGDHRWLLERLRPDEYGAKHDGFGLRPADVAKPLTPAQEEHRMVQMIAHPTKRMRKCLAEALRRGNAAVQQIVDEHVRTRPMVTEGVESTESDPEQLSAPQVDLESRKVAFEALLSAHARVALGGCSKSGKTTVFAPLCTDRPVVHTDDYIEEAIGQSASERARLWRLAAEKAHVECSQHAAFLVEGVRVTGVIRDGLEVDVLVWLDAPLIELTKGQETQRKGREKTLEKLQESMPGLKVVRL